MKKPLVELIACARRELELRKRAYPSWVRQGRMSQEKSNHEIQCMEQIVERLEMLETLRQVSEEMKEVE